ncbi:MAG: hypothetical protein LBH42_10695 [Treponema sp.]|jgi:hypothetical protein|nr:hypothetical protein [Treponema sp.]
MNRRFTLHLFWGSHSPFYALTGAGLIIMASSRLAFAIVCTGAIFWVYGFTALVYTSSSRIMPLRGKIVILLFLSTFLCAFYMLIVSLINPLLIFGTSFFLLLVPPCCLGTGFYEAAESEDSVEAVSRALLEAMTLSGIILAFALIREPLGMGTLSFPGGIQGIIELFDNPNAENFVPARILSVSAGGFFLLGYGTAIYRYFREQNVPRSSQEDD